MQKWALGHLLWGDGEAGWRDSVPWVVVSEWGHWMLLHSRKWDRGRVEMQAGGNDWRDVILGEGDRKESGQKAELGCGGMDTSLPFCEIGEETQERMWTVPWVGKQRSWASSTFLSFIYFPLWETKGFC